MRRRAAPPGPVRLHDAIRAMAGAALATVVLGGCATLPPPSREAIQHDALRDTALPSDWSSAASGGAVADNWIATFGDPELDRLVAEAIARNTDLRVAAARVEQAAAQVDIAQAQLHPALGILARASTKPLSDLVAMAAGAILRLAWEIDLWGRLRYARNATQAMADASSADYRYAQQSIAAAVARTWFVAAETARQKQLALQMVRDADSLVALADERLRVGAGSEDELLLASTNAASYQDAARQVDLAHTQALRALETLLGRYPGATIAARGDLPPFPAATPAGIPIDVLSRRPDMIAAEQRVAAAFNRVGEAKASFLPSLSVLFGIGRLHSSTNGFEDQPRNTSSASATVVAPIYTGGELTGNLRLRTAEQEQAVADYGRLALQAFNEAEDALNAEQVLASREAVLQKAALDSRRIVDLERTAYQVGRTDLRSVNQSLLAANAIEVTLLHVRRERLSQRVGLHLALGGSFGAVPAEADATPGGAPDGAP